MNTSDDEKRIYTDFSVRYKLDITIYAGSNKVFIWHPQCNKMFNVDSNVDYFEYEECSLTLIAVLHNESCINLR